jgi:2-polyprenyl-6-methoxyphenol hydroxylase-like FAD-dependent oxidoreductase
MDKRAVVIGGSIGGLFAGLLLRRIGWDVSIHERAGEEFGSRGAGIATPTNRTRRWPSARMLESRPSRASIVTGCPAAASLAA